MKKGSLKEHFGLQNHAFHWKKASSFGKNVQNKVILLLDSIQLIAFLHGVELMKKEKGRCSLLRIMVMDIDYKVIFYLLKNIFWLSI
jgi:hypothetical protein